MAAPRTALVLLAHTDDETLGCGGTIARLTDEGWTVRVVLLTDGIVTARRGEPEDNRRACADACRILGVEPATLLGFPDQMLDQSAITDLTNAVQELEIQADLIISHSSEDLNIDHRVTAEVAKVVGRPLDGPVSLLACEIPGSSFWSGLPFAANYFMDIESTFDRKVQAFAQYENEVRRSPSPSSIEGIERLARYQGMQAGIDLAEAFTVIRATHGQLP